MSAKNQFIVTIDGPGGSGKDTLADQLLAKHFQSYHAVIANTGHFSRHIAHQALLNGKNADQVDFRQLAIGCMDKMDFFTIDAGPLFTPEVEEMIPFITAIPEIPAGFKERMPGIVAATDYDVVLVLGRITGRVFKDANAKFLLETSFDVCSDRRATSRAKKGENYDTAFNALLKRNESDVANWNSDSEWPTDTIVINTNGQKPQDVYDIVVSKLDPALSAWKNQ